ncbi:MAG: hypothetical protein K5678_08145 [Acetatifactor sp.]|nr:hypothetical protein [Acetatifactor sp.]
MSETISRIFAIVGIAGSILCALGDYFLYRCNGTDSVRIGKDKKIESNWDKADLNDFVRSGVLLAKVNKVFKTFPLALTNTLGLGGIAIIALFCM